MHDHWQVIRGLTSGQLSLLFIAIGHIHEACCQGGSFLCFSHCLRCSLRLLQG